MKIEPDSGWEGLATLSFVAVLGGLARQMHQWLDGKHLTWKHFVARAVISTLIGVVCFYALPRESPWSYAACALFAWLGADGIAMLTQLIFKRK